MQTAKKINFDRQPLPSHLEAEMALLSGAMLIPEYLPVMIETIRPDDFYVKSHNLIFEAMCGLFGCNQPVDLLTVKNRLQQAGQLEDIRGVNEMSSFRGVTYLSFLTDSVPIATNVQAYSDIVRDKAMLRRLVAAGQSIMQDAWHGVGDPREIADRAEKTVFSVSDSEKRKKAVMLKYLLDGRLDHFEKVQQNQQRIQGIPTGYEDIDKMLSGLNSSDLIILAARPSMGKTAFALNVARRVAEKGYPVGFFSLEMSAKQLCDRVIFESARVDSRRVRNGFINREDWGAMMDAADRLQTIPLYIDDSPALTPLEVRARARRLASDHGIQLFFVDYLQLMHGGGNFEKREREVSEISAALKALAKELDVPVVALSQLNRKVEDRADRRPKLSDLRDSGSIEQDADVVAFIYRDEVYDRSENNPNRGKAELLVEKHRNGPTGVVSLYFEAAYTRFESLMGRGGY